MHPEPQQCLVDDPLLTYLFLWSNNYIVNNYIVKYTSVD